MHIQVYNSHMPNNLDFAFASSGEIRAALAERLKAARLGRNMQQSELAAAAGVSRGTVQNLESKAQCSFDSLVRVAMALGMEDDLASVFVRRPTSIAEMEAAERPSRRRATGRGGA
jgi:transcriptional regulator with XRE-family HTH domain